MSPLLLAHTAADHADVPADAPIDARHLLTSAFVLLLTILICYPYAAWFSLEEQIFGHATMILSAVMLKLTYLLRCIAQQALHLPVG